MADFNLSNFSTTSLEHNQDFIIPGLHVYQDALECEERSGYVRGFKALRPKSQPFQDQVQRIINFQYFETVLLHVVILCFEDYGIY